MTPSHETVNALLASLGLKVTRQVDDICFVEHNLFLVIDSKDDNMLLLCFNQECPSDIAALAALTIYAKAGELGLDIGLSGSYQMEELAGEEVKLHFHPQQTVTGGSGSNVTH